MSPHQRTRPSQGLAQQHADDHCRHVIPQTSVGQPPAQRGLQYMQHPQNCSPASLLPRPLHHFHTEGLQCCMHPLTQGAGHRSLQQLCSSSKRPRTVYAREQLLLTLRAQSRFDSHKHNSAFQKLCRWQQGASTMDINLRQSQSHCSTGSKHGTVEAVLLECCACFPQVRASACSNAHGLVSLPDSSCRAVTNIACKSPTVCNCTSCSSSTCRPKRTSSS